MSEKLIVDGKKLLSLLKEHQFYLPGAAHDPVITVRTVELMFTYCRLPLQPDTELRARIEAAMKEFQGEAKPLSLREVRNLFLWLSGQAQDTWSDADFGLEGGEEG